MHPRGSRCAGATACILQPDFSLIPALDQEQYLFLLRSGACEKKSGEFSGTGQWHGMSRIPASPADGETIDSRSLSI